MSSIIKNIALKYLILLLVVQTINLSINSVDFYNTFNIAAVNDDDSDYVDSMVEYVVENLFGFSSHTIHDKANIDNSSKQQQTSLHIDLKWFPNDVVISDIYESMSLNVSIVPKNEQLISLYFKEVPVKPPQI
jgi:hypothetical protein